MVELYINNQYHGLYLLTEHNEIKEGRVNINEAEKDYQETDIGYLIEYDNYAEDEKYLEKFQIDYNNKSPLYQWNGKEYEKNNIFNIGETGGRDEVLNYWYAIKSQINNEEQNFFIKNYLENIYRMLYECIINQKYFEFNNDKTSIKEANKDKYKNEKDYLEHFLNIDSAIAALILQEIACDYDVSNSSFYMNVDFSPSGDEKLTFNLPWDFDNALGNRKFETKKLEKEKGLYAANSMNPWLVLLYQSETIRDGINKKWEEIKNHQVFNKIFEFIDDVSNKYVDEFDKNYKKWYNIGKYKDELAPYIKDWDKNNTIEGESYGWMFYLLREEASINCKTQKDASNQLKGWLTKRLEVLNKIFV